MNKVIKYLMSINHLLFIVGLLLISIDFNCFNVNFYEKEYEKLNTASTIGMSQEELLNATTVLLDYTRDERSDMLVNATINGIHTEVFNEREKDHMADVKNLYLNAMRFKNVFLLLELAMIGLLIVIKKWNTIVFWETFKIAAISFVFVLLFFLLFALIDFDSFWRNFHEIFFTNDLWLLDPRTDILIMMVPLQFFYDLVMRIVITFVLLFGLFTTGVYYFKRKGIAYYD